MTSSFSLSVACSGKSGTGVEEVTARANTGSTASTSQIPDVSPDEEHASGTIKVVTTLYPLEYFAGRIAGDTAEVTNLIPSGTEAHDFEPSPGDIQKLSDADVIIYNGAGFEHWLDRALSSVGTQAMVVEAAEGIAESYKGEAENDNHTLDPHVWLDPVKAIAQARAIQDAMISRNPGAASRYNANAEALVQELEELHHRYERGLATCRHVQIVTSHSAFGYMARRYRLEPVPLAGLTPEAEPTPRRLASLLDRLRELNISYVFTEPGASESFIATVAREIGATILELNPLESLTPAELARGETYFTIMDTNLKNLKTALECGE